jgi:sugar lactone lactonase YvrE
VTCPGRPASWFSALTFLLACSSPAEPPAGPPPGMAAPAERKDAAPRMEPAPDAAPAPPPAPAPQPMAVDAPLADPGSLPDASGTTVPSPPDGGTVGDAAPALGEFPLAAVRAARPERIAQVVTPCEGPSWRDGEVFFGHRDGLMRVSADRKLFRYLPELAFSVGSYRLADGSLLVAGREHKLMQVLRDGKVAVLSDDLATNSNDVTVDAQGNIYFSDFRTAIFKITPEGQVTRALANLTSPNGVEVDPASENLYFISGARVLRAALPRAGGAFGPIETVITLEGGGDGCAFDAWGNLWVAIFGPGRLAIVDVVRRQVITTIGAGGASTTNLTFGGPNHDEVFTTVSANGVYRIPVGARGFAGHPGAPRYTPKRTLDLVPANLPVP